MSMNDWFMNYGNAPGSPVYSSGPQLPPGSSPNRVPDWLMKYGNDPTKAPGASYNDVFNAPYSAQAASQPGANWSPEGGVPNQGAYAPGQGPGQQVNMANPFGSPGASQASTPNPYALSPLPPMRFQEPNPGPPMDITPQGAAAGNPGGQASAVTNEDQTAGQYWNAENQRNAGQEDRQVGPGSWMSKIGGMMDPNSLVGRMFAQRNPSAAPQQQRQPEGLLAPLFKQGGMFGGQSLKAETPPVYGLAPNNTTGGLW